MKYCKICGKPLADERFDMCMDCYREKNSSVPKPKSIQTLQNYLKGGYFDGKGIIKKEVIIDFPQQIASLLIQKKMTSASLRRFYAQVKAIERHAEQETDFDRIKPELYSLQSVVKYSKGRNIVPEEFVQFIDENVALASRDKEHLKAFIKHFESVIAFFKYQNPK